MLIIKNMALINSEQLLQCGEILTNSLPRGWKNLEEAMREIQERLIPENILLCALIEEEVVGWAGMLAPEYDGRVFELHPLAVKEKYRGQGIGEKLVTALESIAKEKGGLTLWAGSDDDSEEGETSFANINLYENLPDKMTKFKAGHHPGGFYLKIGFTLVGVLPNASGPGKPDLFFAKDLSVNIKN